MRWVVIAAALALLPSCAYYNTYYLARKYYLTATDGQPYPFDKPLTPGAQAGNYQKSVDFAKKVVSDYPKSKWADDAYLMWARALLGKEDPLQSIVMLQDFERHFPNSPLKNQATFYLGVSLRQARKYREALVPLEEFLAKEPKNALAPYAHLERARALMALDRPADAALAAGEVIERYPKSMLVDPARAIRAEGLLAAGDPVHARADFQALGLSARSDDDRFDFLLREADCLEAARDYTSELALLNDAIAHEVPPPPTPAGQPVQIVQGSGADRYGRLKLRIGTSHLLAGKKDQALDDYKSVLTLYPKSNLGAEAQYRIGFAYETVLDDFDVARQEYGKVRDQASGSAFSNQATQRLASLDRLAKYRNAGADSLGKQTEAGFLLAEQYLFQLNKPDRALEEYTKIATEHPGTDAAAKAMVAEAWVLSRKMDKASDADSLLWKVVHEYPATEAQLAARDYLEAAGQRVPADLIKLPESLAANDSAGDALLASTPVDTTRLGVPQAGGPMFSSALAGDSLSRAPRSPRDELVTGGATSHGSSDFERGPVSAQSPAPVSAQSPTASNTPPSAAANAPAPATANAPAPASASPSSNAGAVAPPATQAPALRAPRGGSPLDDPPRPSDTRRPDGTQ